VLASAEVTALEFRVLGPLEVRRDGEVVPISAPKQRVLLGFLLLHANEPVTQDELIDQLWGENAPPTARASLQNQVHAIRRLLGAEVLERQSGGYVIHVESGRLDLERFERLVAEARRAGVRERAVKLREALACWRGPALVEFPSEPFARYEIGRLEEQRLAALEERIEADLELGLHVEAVAELEALVEKHPVRERLWAQLMIALYRAGRQAEAADTYRRARDSFTTQLGIDPGVELRDLQRAVLAQSPALDDADRRPGSALERAAAFLPRDAAEQARWLHEFGDALVDLGERRRAASAFRTAEKMAAVAGEPVLAARVRLSSSLLDCYMEGRRGPLAHLAVAEEVARVCKQHGDEEGLAVALRHQSSMLGFSGRWDEAAARIERAIELAARVGSVWEESLCRGLLTRALVEGTLPVKLAFARCEAELEQASTPQSRPLAEYALAVLHAEAGRLDEARAIAGRALGSARESGHVQGLFRATDALARVEEAAGDLARATEHLRAAYALLEADDDHGTLPTCGAILACALERLGEIEEAGDLARSARAGATRADDFYAEVWWRLALALVVAHEGQRHEAIRLSEEAVARVSASDALLFRGKTLEEAARVRGLAGDRAGAEEALRYSLAEYESKGSMLGAERVRRAGATAR
jgi:DNA-binding SARP family transcriptional activator